MSLKPNLEYEHGFAILRHDSLDVTVKKVLWDYEEAKSEVVRLNTLSKREGRFDVRYTSQLTRVARRVV